MGAIASGGVVLLNDDVVRGAGVSPDAIEEVTEQESRELTRREHAYREDRPMTDVRGPAPRWTTDSAPAPPRTPTAPPSDHRHRARSEHRDQRRLDRLESPAGTPPQRPSVTRTE
jgi:hypothetical protein